MAKKEEGISMKHYDDFVVQNNHKVLSPLEVEPGINIYSLYREHPFKVHNRWLVLELDDTKFPLQRRAFCVLLYGHRAYTPGETTKWIELTTLKRSEWRMT
jgi:hypothetical protein